MTDVAPELLKDIMTSFRSRAARDRRLHRISGRLSAGTATLNDAHDYAAAVGEDMSAAMVAVLTPSRLPDGKLYYNIAARTIKPALMEVYDIVNDTADQVQKIVDVKAKIRLGTVRAEFPEERIDGLIDKAVSDLEDTEAALKWLTEPIINNAEAFFDDYVDRQAGFREDVGLKARITRKAESGCCAWCAEREGSWDYGDEPDDVYARHEYCRCSVTYTADRVAQNVWTKAKWTPTRQDYERMRSVEPRQTMTVEERKKVLAG